MSERYFEISKEHQLYHDYFSHIEKQEKAIEILKEFTDHHGFGRIEIAFTPGCLFIKPEKQHVDMIGKVTRKQSGDGEYYQFKQNSPFFKDWKQRLSENGLKLTHKPVLWLYMKGESGRHRSRIFHVGERLYGSREPYSGELPEGFIEMKGSEFHKIMEEAA